jgi:hypothetical protein
VFADGEQISEPGSLDVRKELRSATTTSDASSGRNKIVTIPARTPHRPSDRPTQAAVALGRTTSIGKIV